MYHCKSYIYTPKKYLTHLISVIVSAVNGWQARAAFTRESLQLNLVLVKIDKAGAGAVEVPQARGADGAEIGTPDAPQAHRARVSRLLHRVPASVQLGQRRSRAVRVCAAVYEVLNCF